MIYVKPLKGRVIDPETRKPLPPEGKRVKPSRYWDRRVRDGDAEIVKPPKPKPKKTAPKDERTESKE